MIIYYVIYSIVTIVMKETNIYYCKMDTEKKNLVVLIRNLVDSTSLSVGKWTNQNSFRNYQISMVNFFLLNLLDFLDNLTKFVYV